MKKMLIVATVPSMIGQFNMNNIQLLKDLGFEVHIACDFYDRSVWTEERIKEFVSELDKKQVVYHQVDFARSPFNIKKNLCAYKQLSDLVYTIDYKFIHCHTPVAGIVSRIVAHQKKIKVIYTAHGFHFYNGAPKLNWLLFYPIEKFFSKWTDTLITINKEDYKRAKSFNANRVEYIPGIGINVKAFSEKCEIDKIRKDFGYNTDDFVFVSVGQLSTRKNHQVIIKAMAKIDNPKIKYLIVGIGELSVHLKKIIADNNLESRVHLAGYRTDVDKILHIADAYVFPSLQEGLPVSLMEAMAAGLPIVCSRIRGNVDLIENGQGGYLCDPTDVDDFKNKMLQIYNCDNQFMKDININKISHFDVCIINKRMKEIYSRYL